MSIQAERTKQDEEGKRRAEEARQRRAREEAETRRRIIEKACRDKVRFSRSFDSPIICLHGSFNVSCGD